MKRDMIFAAVSALLLASAASAQQPERKLVEVWREGDYIVERNNATGFLKPSFEKVLGSTFSTLTRLFSTKYVARFNFVSKVMFRGQVFTSSDQSVLSVLAINSKSKSEFSK